MLSDDGSEKGKGVSGEATGRRDAQQARPLERLCGSLFGLVRISIFVFGVYVLVCSLFWPSMYESLEEGVGLSMLVIYMLFIEGRSINLEEELRRLRKRVDSEGDRDGQC